MALVQRCQLQLRAHQLALREANRVLAEHEQDLVVAESHFKICKKRIKIKIVLALIQQNVFRQRLLFRRWNQLNRVRHFFKFIFFLPTIPFVLPWTNTFFLQVQNLRQRRLRRLVEKAELAVVLAEGHVAMSLVRVWRSRLRHR